MIRKQVYLTKEANDKLIKLAQDRNTSQAELIREGLEHYLTTLEREDSELSWSHFLEEMRHSNFKLSKWNRDELYAADERRGGNDERTD